MEFVENRDFVWGRSTRRTNPLHGTGGQTYAGRLHRALLRHQGRHQPTFKLPRILSMAARQEPESVGTWIRDHVLADKIMHYSDDGIHEPTGHGEPSGPPNGVMDDASLDLLERFVMDATSENRDAMLVELDMVPEPGNKDLGERAAKKGSLVGYIIALFGTERSLTEREIGDLQRWFEKGRKD